MAGLGAAGLLFFVVAQLLAEGALPDYFLTTRGWVTVLLVLLVVGLIGAILWLGDEQLSLGAAAILGGLMLVILAINVDVAVSWVWDGIPGGDGASKDPVKAAMTMGAAGILAGGLVGSIIPGAGTVSGGIVGGVAGAAIGFVGALVA